MTQKFPDSFCITYTNNIDHNEATALNDSALRSIIKKLESIGYAKLYSLESYRRCTGILATRDGYIWLQHGEPSTYTYGKVISLAEFNKCFS